MKKLFSILSIILIPVFMVVGCANRPNTQEEVHKESLTYSNLTDSSSQEEVKRALENAGIPSGNIDSFFESVNSFNNTIEKKSLTKNGFVTINSLEPTYDEIAIQDSWNAKNPIFIGSNCRITSFNLMKDIISIDNPSTENSSNLFMDIDALETDPQNPFDKTKQNEFESLYSFIPTENVKDISIHLKNVQEDWNNKGINFLNKDKVSVISVLFHSYEDKYLFVGHTGVLVPIEDEKLLFIEKLSFQTPYQAIKFNNRTELNDYLMRKYDVSYNQPIAKPFIMENNQLLKGYRENPNNPEGNNSPVK